MRSIVHRLTCFTQVLAVGMLLWPCIVFAQQERPNVLLILVDNQSFFELSCHGHAQLKTPQIDALASESVDFVNFHAPPFCSPSRGAMLTGRYALRLGIHNTIGGVSILQKDEATLADYLKAAGYATAIFGKWHLGLSYPYHPSERGFDEVFIHGGGGIGQLEDYYGNRHTNATWDHNGTFVKSKGFSTDVLFDRAAVFIEKHRNEPFFCFLSTPATHTPYEAEPRAMKRILERGVEASEGDLKLYSMVENIDENVGDLMDRLYALELRENTMVIFATDQGVSDRGAPEPRFQGKRASHPVAFDEKHAVTCMVRYPPLTMSGQQEALAGMVDLAPTILDVCGLPRPSSTDGRSLRPLLAGASQWDDERTLIVQCPRGRVRKKWDNTSVKTQQWRLVGGDQLFDIRKDPGQRTNVAEGFPKVVATLSTAYDRFWESLPHTDTLLSRHTLGSSVEPSTRLNGMDWYRGGAPWHQLHLKRQHQNGVWAVSVARSGRYRFELRWYPREAPTAIGALGASVRVGGAFARTDMAVGDASVELELALERGDYDMETAFKLPPEADQGRSWGAYFVQVEYLGAE